MRVGRLPTLAAALAAAAWLTAAGCAPLWRDSLGLRPPSGATSLRRVSDPARWPDLTAAFEGRDGGLLEALDRSLSWFDGPSSLPAYPFAAPEITHERARAGVAAFRAVLKSSTNAAEFRVRLAQEFDLFASVGSDGQGTVLFTGYYTPVFRASRIRTGEYRYPLYGRPPDLVLEAESARALGRAVKGAIVPYPTRAEIERDPEALGLAGREIAWLASELDAFLVQVQGSARLDLDEGGAPFQVGYAGSNGRPYTSIGRLLVEDRKIERGRATLPAIRAYFGAHPGELGAYLGRNDRFVFFRETPPENWPEGSLGFPVTPLRTLATDKTIFPRGGVVFVQTTLATADGGGRPFEQFMVDQDTGGAILAPGRADLYLGTGDAAGEVAGRQSSRGRMSFFVLKPERVAVWAEKARPGEFAGGD